MSSPKLSDISNNVVRGVSGTEDDEAADEVIFITFFFFLNFN